jgi:hypothetical protein
MGAPVRGRSGGGFLEIAAAGAILLPVEKSSCRKNEEVDQKQGSPRKQQVFRLKCLPQMASLMERKK